MFIAFDGIDGSGKTTISKEVYNYYKKDNHSVELYDMGTYGVLDDFMHSIRNTKTKLPSEVRELLFYLEGKLFSEYITENEDKTIIADRYYLTYYAYGPLNGLNQETIWKLVHNLKKPNHYFFIDVPPETALKRISAYRKIDPPEIGYRNKLSANEENNRASYLIAQNEIYQNYLSAIKRFDFDVHLIDGLRDPHEILEEVISVIGINK